MEKPSLYLQGQRREYVTNLSLVGCSSLHLGVLAKEKMTVEKQLLGDRYEVLQELGKKAGRQTLLACDLKTQDLVVLKILRFSSDFEWDDLKLFEREAATLRNLSHPSIPRYLDFFELDTPDLQGFALVQTYIPAKSLEEHRNAGRTFSEAEITQLAKDLLAILSYLHECHPSVLHRDLKPSNILLGDGYAALAVSNGRSIGQVYLVDFGSVQTVAAREGGSITVVGTYGYMPPEQFGGRAVPASDLYSLGATLIYLVCGHHPADLPQKELKLQFEQVVRLSPQLTSWLQKMTEPSLEQRFHSAKEALQALERGQIGASLPTKTSKPVYSRIIINRSIAKLEMILPPQGFRFRYALTLTFFFGASWITIGVFIITICFPFLLNGHFLLVIPSIPFFWIGFWILSPIFFQWFVKKRISITQQKICETYEIFGRKYQFEDSPLKQPIAGINSIDFVKSSFHKQGFGRDSYYKINPKLTLYLKYGGMYQIGGDRVSASLFDYHCHLTDSEVEWLAKELNDWLRVSIKYGF